MEWVYVELRRGSDDAVLASTWVTDNDGRYTFPAITNPGAAGFRVRAWCYHNNTHSCDGKALRVVPPGEGRDDGGNLVSPCYSVSTGIMTSGDGTYDAGTWHVVNGDTNEPAWWIMMDLNKAFWWPYWWNDHTTMNGGVTVEWSSTSTHGDHNHRTDDGGNIHLKAASPNVCDVVLHEYGHEVQWDGYGQWLPSSDCPSPHYLNAVSGSHCAWYEGFANWFKFAVSNDPVYHWAGGGSLNCETPTWGTAGWDDGDQVEGRTAGAMWDIGDSNADGYDTCQLSWEYIWDTWYGSVNRDNTFSEFWTRWKNRGNPKHHPIKALYQNTIDYNTGPTFSGLPDVSTSEDTPKNNVIDLWDFAYDPESSDSELEYTITGNTNPNCGVSIDPGDFVDINPAPNWYGSSTVTIRCSDGIRSASDSFVVMVTPVNDPPVISGLPDRTLNEDTTLDNTIDLWAYTSDVDNPDSALTYTITANTNPSCGVSIDSNRYIDIYPSLNWYGISDVTVRVTDPGGLWSEDTFRITVNPVNDPPVLYGIPDQLLYKNSGRNNAIDLWLYAQDVETSDGDMVYTITTNTDPNCGVSIDANDFVDIYPAINWTGYSDVTIRATDEGGLWAESTFRIVVANHASTISEACNFANGEWVALTGKITTARFENYYYIEEPNRTSGIRVYTPYAYSPGYELTIAGKLSTSYAERQITPYYQKVTNEGIWVQPLQIRNDWLGGASPNPFTPSVPEGGKGAYNVGLLVRTTGRVIDHAGNRFFISDGGSIIDNTSGVPSVLVDSVPSGYKPPIGYYVSITGISGASTLGGIPMRILRPRSENDIVIHKLNVAYIYDTNPGDAETFKNWLDSQALSTALIPRYKVESTNFGKYHVILIGSDTGNWSDALQVTAVLAAGLPIIGIGEGGAKFMDRVTSPDLYIGWLHSAIFTDTHAFAFGGEIYTHPNFLGVSIGDTFQVFGSPGTTIVGLYDPNGITTRLLRHRTYQSYFPVASEGGLFYQWGFYEAPNKMTELGRRLFTNLVFSTAR
ncbi:MAG: Ig-like domain-containing protein [Armatimonadota bacterium]